MAKFVYRMQNILNIKEKIENQEKIAYGMANAKLAEEQDKLQAILVRRADYEAKSRELVSGSIKIRDIKECKRAIDIMKTQQRSQMMYVHAAERNVAAARERLNAAMVERKTQEILREKAFEAFKEELKHEEAREIDELVSYHYHEESEQES